MKMDETRRIADELNRCCYSENVLKYFFNKPDADSEDECSDTKATVSHWKTSVIYN